MTGKQSSGSQQSKRRRFGNNNNKGNKTNSTKPHKKTLQDHQYYLGSAKQASDCQQATEFIINHIKKVFEYGADIGSALEELQAVNMNQYKPKLQVSVKTEEAKSAEDRQFEMEFKAEFDLYTKRKQVHENNLTKACASLWEQCSKAMQNKVEAHKDFLSAVKGNPMEPLKAIKQHALNFQDTRCPMSILHDSIKAVINLKQREGENLQECTKRFETAKDVMVSHLGGPLVLAKCVENMSGHDKTNPTTFEACQSKAFQTFMTCTHLENSDKAKCGTLMSGLSTQQSLGNDQHPTKLSDATEVLSNHRFDDAGETPKTNNQKDDKGKSSSKEEKEESLMLSFAQMEGKCHCCGKQAHKSPQC